MGALSNQFAIVTGAGSGIGKAIALALGAYGAVVGLVGRTQSKLEASATAFDKNRPDPVIFLTDLTIDEQQDTLKADIESRFGQVDILVLCAGEIAHGPTESAPVEEFDKLYRANVRANYRLVQTLLPMLRKGPGQIVFINSSMGLSARPNAGQYAATQHALRAFSDALRAEVNSDAIRVLSVYPGRVATPRQKSLYQRNQEDYMPQLLLQPEDIASVVLNALVLPRTAEVTEISIRPLAKSY